jgi:hypothetical protein
MLKWLNVEKERMPFIISFLEKSENIYVGQLPLKLTIDRIDRISSGENLIIDYKTGANCNTSFWDGDRPKEPQLLLYGLCNKTNMVGIAFGQIHISAQRFLGCTKLANLLPEVMESNKNWDDRVAQWKESLEILAEEFMEGYAVAANMNKSNSDLNQYLAPLNRLNEDNLELYMDKQIFTSKKIGKP